MYASTPSAQPHRELSCPVLADEGTRRIHRRYLDVRGGSLRILHASDLSPSDAAFRRSTGSGLTAFSAQGQWTGNSRSRPSSSERNGKSPDLSDQAADWLATAYRRKSASEATHHVYLVPSASEPLREGFVRVINHSGEAGEVSIDPVDDGGRAFDMITLSIDANETVHFNSTDLETGNEGKGLTGSRGSGEGDWRLEFTSDLDIEVLAYIRTTDGFLTAMHDVAPADGNIRRVAIFNPGSNQN